MLQSDINTIDEMFSELRHAPRLMHPSKVWEGLNYKNLSQLKDHGLENMRNTVACNYFTFLGDRMQFRFLKSHLSKIVYLQNKLRALFALKSGRVLNAVKKTPLSLEFLKTHTYYTHMLFDYVKLKDDRKVLKRATDSPLFNPPPVYRWGRLITADLANSILEYYSIVGFTGESVFKNVMELGAGYGRNAALLLQLYPHMRYIIVDIPPALYVAQAYLTKRFPTRKAFLFRPFRSFDEIKQEWEQASMCFLLPHQVEYLPDKSINLFLNISSFHEMRHDQIAYYFKKIDRLLRGYFYIKQWKKSYLPADNTLIREEDYPEFPHWSRLYSRTCEVQTAFFERLSFVP
jgi:putative sugar O-methyltransferase